MSYQILLGCYTNQNKNTDAMPAEGIYLLNISDEGKLEESPVLLAKQDSPTYFYLRNNKKVVYAVSEPGPGAKGSISAYQIERSGNVALQLFSHETAAGAGLCHVNMDPAEKNLVVISYPDATIQSFPTSEDGTIQPMFCLRRHVGSGPVLDRQESAHAHSAVFTPDGKYMAVCDLGTDMIYLYSMIEEVGKIHRAYGMNVVCPPGSGPRHLAFSPDGKNAYVTCELNNTVLTLRYDEKGLEIVEEVSTLSHEFDIERNYPSAVRVSGDGRLVYVSNRGEDTIAVFARDLEKGLLTFVKSYSTMGWYPRDFILTEDERFLIAVNQLSDNLVVYKNENGVLKMTENCTIVQKPVALLEI